MKACPSCGAACIDEARFCPRCGGDIAEVAAREGDALLGVTIAGRFVLRRLVGEGGMGRVYKADQSPVGRTVAVKIMHQHLIGDEAAAARFVNEAMAASKINHPNTIAVLDSGRTESGLLYMAMEYLPGFSLEKVMVEESLPLGRILKIVSQVLSALEAAHELGFVHRDIKPANIFVERTSGSQDFVKLIDFGIVKIRDDTQGLTTPGFVTGTPEYMSPEQAKGEDLDTRCDLYTLGVVLYQLLTGELPFTGENAMEVMIKHVREDPTPLEKFRNKRNIPTVLDTTVMRSLAKNPNERIQTATEFKRLIEQAVASLGPAELWNVEPQAGRPPSSVMPVASSTGQLTKPLTPRRIDASFIVGRKAERRKLAEMLASKQGRALWIYGENGVGKTRLAAELRRAAEKKKEALVVWVEGDPRGAGDPLYPMQQMAAALLEVELPLAGEATLKKAALDVGLDSDDLAGLREVFPSLGLPPDLESEPRLRERSVAVGRLARCAAKRRPTIVIFDGVDRYDTPSRRSVEGLLASAEQCGIIALATSTEQPGANAAGVIELMELEPLSEDDARELARATCSERDAVENICEASSGNPLWITQLGELVSEGGPARAQRLGDILAARMEALQPVERETLQWFAACGESADTRFVERAFGVTDLADRAQRLVDRGLLRVRPRGYRFRHLMVAEVAEAWLPAEVRRSLHKRILAQLTRASPVARAHHVLSAASNGLESIEAADRAACWAARCLDDDGAALWFHRAQELIRQEWARGATASADLERWSTMLARKQAETLRRIGQTQAADGTLREALDVASGRPVDRARILYDLARGALDAGAADRAATHLREAAQLLEDAKLSGWLEGEIQRLTGIAKLRLGDFESASTDIERGLRKARPAGDKDAAWSSLVEAAKAYLMTGDLGRGRKLLRRAERAAQGTESIRGRLVVLDVLCELPAATNGAGGLAETMVELARESGDRERLVRALLKLGLERKAGSRAEAASLIHRAMELAERIGEKQLTESARAELAELSV